MFLIKLTESDSKRWHEVLTVLKLKKKKTKKKTQKPTSKCVSCMVLWAQVKLKTPGLYNTLLQSDSITWLACWRPFCRALAVLLLFLLTQRNRYWCCCWLDAHLWPCPALLLQWAQLLVPPPHSYAGRQQTFLWQHVDASPWRRWTACSAGPSHANSSDKNNEKKVKLEKNQSEGEGESSGLWPPPRW